MWLLLRYQQVLATDASRWEERCPHSHSKCHWSCWEPPPLDRREMVSLKKQLEIDKTLTSMDLSVYGYFYNWYHLDWPLFRVSTMCSLGGGEEVQNGWKPIIFVAVNIVVALKVGGVAPISKFFLKQYMVYMIHIVSNFTALNPISFKIGEKQKHTIKSNGATTIIFNWMFFVVDFFRRTVGCLELT